MKRHQEQEGQTRGDERRAELAQAAYQIIAEKGFEGLRVRDVAAQAGVNIATLHYYFATKEDLVKAVVDHLFHLFLTVEAPLPPDIFTPSPVLAMRQLFADLKHQLETAPDMFIVLNELHLRSQRDPSISEILKGLDNGWRAHMVGIYQEGVEMGVFNPELTPEVVASVLIALIKGMSIQAISQLDQFDFFRISNRIEDWLTSTPAPSP